LEERAAPVAKVDEFGETIVEDADPLVVDNQEDDLAGCCYSSCKEQDEASGDDDYGEEEEAPTIEEMLWQQERPPEMLHGPHSLEPQRGPRPNRAHGHAARSTVDKVREEGREAPHPAV
jgi:hypothetical protein